MTTWRFDDFALDPAARELHRAGEAVALPARALDCLIYLIEHRDRAVGRDELIAAVWGRVEISDALLNHTIVKLRRALGDTGNEQRTIRTVPRFGYRWVLELAVLAAAAAPVAAATADSVAPVEAESSLPASPQTIAQATPRVSPRSWRAVAIGVLALAAVIAIAFTFTRRHASVVVHDPANAAATTALVLPADVVADAEWRWLRLGAMDLVANRLRGGAQPTLASESVLGLLRAHPDRGSEQWLHDGDLAAVAALRVWPRIRHVDRQWFVRLDAVDAGGAHSVETQGDDPVSAVRDAADALLRQYGRVPNVTGAVQATPEVEDLLERTGAAMLADRLDDARQLVANAAPALRDAPQIQQRLAQIDLRGGDYSAVESRLDALLDAVPAGRDDALRARAMLTLAAALVRTQALDRAAELYDAALALRKDTADHEVLGVALLGRGSILAAHGKYDAATESLASARTELAAVGDGIGMASIDVNLGEFQLMRHRPGSALPILGDALREFERLGAREGRAFALAQLVDADAELLDGAAALSLSDRFWPPSEATNNARMVWTLSRARAQALALSSRGGEAAQLLSNLLAESDPRRDALARAQAAYLQARLAQVDGDADATRRALAGALVPALRDGDAKTWSRATLLRIAIDAGSDAAAAGEAARALHAWAAEEGADAWRAMQASLADALLAAAAHRGDDALKAFDAAMRGAETFGVPEDLVAVGAPYLDALIAAGRFDTARRISGRIAQWADRDPRAAAAQAHLFRAMGQIDAARVAEDRLRRLTAPAQPAAQ